MTIEALQQQPEPPCATGSQCVGNKCERCAVQLEREWQGLTDAEVIKLGGLDKDSDYFGLWYDFARAIEAKLREKNFDRPS